LFAVTQSATGQQLENGLEHEVINASSSPFQFAEITVTGTVDTTSPFWSEITRSFSDSVNASNTITYDVFTSISASVNASESYVMEETRTFAGGTAFAEDKIYQTTTLPVTHVVTATNTLEMEVEVTLTSTANASEDITPGVTYNQSETSVANASSSFVTGGDLLFADTVNADGTIVTTNNATEPVTAAVNASNTLTPWSVATTIVSAAANASHTLDFAGSIYSDSITGAINAGDNLWARDFGAIAWTMNTQGGGISSYNNFEFESIAFHAGKLYATGPDGMYVLEGDDDAGRNIASHLRRLHRRRYGVRRRDVRWPRRRVYL
jgi:hypothetical protein